MVSWVSKDNKTFFFFYFNLHFPWNWQIIKFQIVLLKKVIAPAYYIRVAKVSLLLNFTSCENTIVCFLCFVFLCVCFFFWSWWKFSVIQVRVATCSSPWWPDFRSYASCTFNQELLQFWSRREYTVQSTWLICKRLALTSWCAGCAWSQLTGDLRNAMCFGGYVVWL